MSITIKIISGANLKAGDVTGKSDPYVQVYHGQLMVFQTKTKYSTLSPVWEQSFTVNSDVQALEFRVFDEDKITKDDLLGTVVLELKDIKSGTNEGHLLNLDTKGSIQLQIHKP